MFHNHLTAALNSNEIFHHSGITQESLHNSTQQLHFIDKFHSLLHQPTSPHIYFTSLLNSITSNCNHFITHTHQSSTQCADLKPYPVHSFIHSIHNNFINTSLHNSLHKAKNHSSHAFHAFHPSIHPSITSQLFQKQIKSRAPSQCRLTVPISDFSKANRPGSRSAGWTASFPTSQLSSAANPYPWATTDTKNTMEN